MTITTCPSCGATEFLTLDSYKRHWHICLKCGTAVSEQKSSYSLGFLPYADLKKSGTLSDEKMYDYFIDETHINWAVGEGQEFIRDYLKPSGLDVAGKSLIDISGGNGHFIKQVEKLGANITLTEFNKKTVAYARKVHGFENVFEYDLNRHDLASLTQCKYDIVFARACIMFARDLNKFVQDMKNTLHAGGHILINHSVVPTLGVMLRTQLDEFSYFILRQPETIIDAFTKAGFTLTYRADETDNSLYVYDHDLLWHWRFVYRMYENRAVKKMGRNRPFALPARDRRRSTLVFRLAA